MDLTLEVVLLRWHRCLGCDSWVLQPTRACPAGSPPLEGPEPASASRRITAARLAADGDWRLGAACRSVDPELFFPISYTGASMEQVTTAKAICSHCPVQPECLAFALRTGQAHGIWGGLTEQERKHTARSGQRAAPGNSNGDDHPLRPP
jgi:WhiB family redox-sensing transcriptional regulator